MAEVVTYSFHLARCHVLVSPQVDGPGCPGDHFKLAPHFKKSHLPFHQPPLPPYNNAQNSI